MNCRISSSARRNLIVNPFKIQSKNLHKDERPPTENAGNYFNKITVKDDAKQSHGAESRQGGPEETKPQSWLGRFNSQLEEKRQKEELIALEKKKLSKEAKRRADLFFDSEHNMKVSSANADIFVMPNVR